MDELHLLNNLIGADAYWMVNKKIAKHFNDNNTAILLADLISKQKYFIDKNEDIEGYFFNTSENIENDCNISYHKQKTCINSLKSEGFLETKRIGLPAKLYFKINPNKILSFLNYSFRKIQNLELEEFELNKNKINNNKYNNIKNIKKEFEEIFDFWNSKKLIVHRDMPKDKVFQDALKISSLEEIKQSIINYEKIIRTSDFYFNHIWTLETFLKKQRNKDNFNFKRFLPDGDIFVGFENSKGLKFNKNKVIDISNNNYDDIMG